MGLTGLVTHYGVPITDELERRGKSIDDFKIYAPHNHVFDNGEGSCCATTTINELLAGLVNSPITQFSLTDHISDFSESNLQKIIKKVKSIEGLSFIPGFEARTQYDELAVLGINPKDILLLKKVLFEELNFNHDNLIHAINTLNKKIRYKNDKIVKGFNHAFSKPLIPANILKIIYATQGKKKDIRLGFDFQSYMFDHWSDRQESDTVESLGIDVFCSKYLLDQKYMAYPDLRKKYQTHETIIQGLMDDFDYVEFNMINFYYSDSRKALLFASKYGLPVMVGGDTHHPHQVEVQGYNLIEKGFTLYQALQNDLVIPVMQQTGLMDDFFRYIQVVRDRGLSNKLKKARK